MYRKIDSFRFGSKFSTWLFRLTINCSIDFGRREKTQNKRWSSLSNITEFAEPEDESPPPEQYAEDGELGEHVQTSLQRLSPKLRSVLVLRYLEGLTYEELAQTLGRSMGTVKSRMARAHVALERVLSGTLGRFGYPDDFPDSNETVA